MEHVSILHNLPSHLGIRPFGSILQALALHPELEVSVVREEALALTADAVVNVAGGEFKPDVVFLRTVASDFGRAVGAALSVRGCRVVNHPVAAAAASDKALAPMTMRRNGVRVLDQFTLTTGGVLMSVPSSIVYPTVAKLRRGWGGNGVFLLNSEEELLTALSGESYQTGGLIVQPFIAHAQCCDTRVFVVGDTVVASMLRTAAPGDFRSNVSQHGSGESVDVDEETAALAVAATATFNLAYAGVDVINTVDGPAVLEVNPLPGILKTSEITGVDIGAAVVAHVFKDV